MVGQQPILRCEVGLAAAELLSDVHVDGLLSVEVS